MINPNYTQFQKLFKKGEQIFVGFNHGETSGFIKTVNENGFGLVQLNNNKEIMYSWDQFNIICTPGFRINKAGKSTESFLWRLVAKNKPKWRCIFPHDDIDILSEDEEYFLKSENLCGLTTKEITKLDSHSVEFKTNGIGGSISFETDETFLSKKKENILTQCGKIDQLTTLKLYILRACKEPIMDYKGLFEYDGIKEHMGQLLNNSFKWEKRVYCGDPWSIEDITKMENGVFWSLQGCLMVKHNSDLWV